MFIGDIVIDTIVVKSVHSVMLLGVMIHNELRFKEHVALLCQEAGRQMELCRWLVYYACALVFDCLSPFHLSICLYFSSVYFIVFSLLCQYSLPTTLPTCS